MVDLMMILSDMLSVHVYFGLKIKKKKKGRI
jgi:hypothetical protein